jgi:V8-like Glu-specific endopeptidase
MTPSELRGRLKAFARQQGSKLEGMFDQDALEARIAKSRLARSDAERASALEVHRKLQRDEDVSPNQMRLYEAIVVPTERPAIFVDDDSYVDAPEPWDGLNAAPEKANLEAAIRAVGRVEISGPTSVPYVGTASVVGPGLLMTNRHVAKVFARGDGLTARFKDGYGAAIDFKSERRSQSRSPLPVGRVRMVHPYWDMALLEIEGLAVPALTLNPVAPDDLARQTVVLIGYPAKDPRNPEDVQDRVFGGVYGVKRLQPGYCLGRKIFESEGRSIETLAHDSSTLGGSSGSAVIDPRSGNVVGLHFAGEYLVANYAVPAFALSRDGFVRDAGVRFAAGQAAIPNPWAALWAATRPREAVNGARPTELARAHTIRIPIEIALKIRVERARSDGEA